MNEMKAIAHSLERKPRTKDVIIEENVSFESLLLPRNILQGLSESGFRKPSPVQIKAIPIGRCGFDLTVKSKSGTGKTLVFSIIALETTKVEKQICQVLLLAPTREIAVQIQGVITSVGKYMEGVSVGSFIGGLSLDLDIKKAKSCHIAVGTPGRIKQLIQLGHLNVSHIRLFVLDEADKLMETSFQNDINEIYNSLPEKKQVIMCSATYPNELENFLSEYMLSPTFVNAELDTPLLLGLKQFVRLTKSSPNIVQQAKAKNQELLRILSSVAFIQCLIYSNYQSRAESICNFLNQNGWSTSFISAAQTQTERLNSLSSLKDFKCRIMISTDLTSRGIDAANVDLVINYDIPVDAMTYLHRMGRAGRYGSTGNCINLALVGQETKLLQTILAIIGGPNLSMPILDDSLNITNSTQDNLLYALVSDDIEKLTDKCKKEVIEMKKVAKTKKNNKNNKKEKNCVPKEDKLLTEKAVEEKLSNMDVSSVLGQLASGTFDMERNFDEAINTDGNATISKAVFSSDTNSMKPKENVTHDMKTLLKMLANEETISVKANSVNEMMEKDETFCKNTALVRVAKSVSNIDSDEGDALNLAKYMHFLRSKEKLETKLLLQEKEEIEDKNSMENYQDVLENIFLLSYRAQVIEQADPWQNKLPLEEKKKLADDYKEDTEHDNIEIQLLRNEYDENFYDEEEEYYDNDEDYDFEMEKDIDVNFAEGMQQDPSQDPNDYSFMKWIPVEPTQKESNLKGSQSINSESQNLSRSGSSRQIEIFNQSRIKEVSTVSDVAFHYKQYAQYFQHCSNHLWQNGLNFESVQNFDNWYSGSWQEQVASVRNFVQQRIYMEEMNQYYQKT